MVAMLKQYQFRQFQEAVAWKKRYWSNLNFASLFDYNRSLQPYRQDLFRCIGVPEELRRGQTITLVSSRLIHFTEEMYVYHWVLSLNESGLQAEALVGVPRRRKPPYPVVIGYYGAMGSPEKVFGLDNTPNYLETFGQTLVRAGYFVYVPYLVVDFTRMTRIDTAGISRDMRLIGLEIGLTMRGLDYLSTRSYIDKDGFSVFGVSWGGTLSRYLGASDPRIKVTLVSGAFSDIRDNPTPAFLEDPTSYYLSYDYFRRFDPVTLAYLIAPRALFIEQGLKDEFEKNRIPEAFAKVQNIYDRLRSPEKVGLEIAAGRHRVYLHESLEFLKRWFPPASTQETPKPTAPPASGNISPPTRRPSGGPGGPAAGWPDPFE